jgi:hypothetical protein
MADFTLLNTPTDAVLTVNGQSGTVVLAKGDVGLGNVTNDAQLKIASNLSDVNNAATAFGNIKQAATATATGVVELATQAEAEAQTDTARAVTPEGLANYGLKKTFTVGDGTATTLTLTHNLNSFDVLTQVRFASDNAVVECEIINATVNTVTLGFNTAPAANSIKAVVIG